MSKQLIPCEVCETLFLKEVKRINRTNFLKQKHTCSKKCAARLTNDARVAPPSSDAAMRFRQDKIADPQKTKARQLLRQAIKTQKIIRPSNCEYCFEECKPDAHHEDHDKPYYIIWVCKPCHRLLDEWKIVGLCTDYEEQVNG